MGDCLDKASAWLEGQRAKHMTRPVVYQRGGVSAEVSATVGRTIFQVDDGDGALLRVESRDFLITAADLVLNGAATLPQRGDRIQEAQGSQNFIYEVLAPGDEPHWRWSDPYRRTLRIHTKQVDVQ